MKRIIETTIDHFGRLDVLVSGSCGWKRKKMFTRRVGCMHVVPNVCYSEGSLIPTHKLPTFIPEGSLIRSSEHLVHYYSEGLLIQKN